MSYMLERVELAIYREVTTHLGNKPGVPSTHTVDIHSAAEAAVAAATPFIRAQLLDELIAVLNQAKDKDYPAVSAGDLIDWLTQRKEEEAT